MAQRTPTIEAFRAVFRQPSLTLAEVSWRWTFWGTVCALSLLTIFEYFDSLPVSAGDALFLRSRQPFLISQALAHILAGSGQRLAAATILLLLTLTALWIFVSSLGRVATLRLLLHHFASAESASARAEETINFASQLSTTWHFRSVLGLNFLRVTLLLAGLLALVSAAILAGFVSTPANPQPGLAFLIFFPLAVLVTVFWSSMNWFLSIASIFVLREGRDVFGAVASSVDFCLRRSRALSWSSTVFGLCHFVVFVIASSVVVFPLAFAGILPGSIIGAAIILLLLLYFAIVDFLYVGRLAAYVCILQMPEPAAVVPPLPALLEPRENSSNPTLRTSGPSGSQSTLAWPPIPPSDDDILSDVPMPGSERGEEFE
jgi:hypothetical protein